MKLFYVEYKIKSSNFHKLSTSFLKNKISIFGVKKDKNSITFKGKIKDKAQTLAILEQSMYNEVECHEFSLKNLMKKNKFEFIGVGVFIAILLVLSQFNFVVEVEGSSKTLTEIESILVENSLDKISLKSKIDKNNLQNQVFNIDGISFCEIGSFCGGLKICVLEKLEVEKTQNASFITSNSEGVISKIVLKSGTALKKVGEKIYEGEVLIEGVVYSKNKDAWVKTYANGEIFAVSTHTFEIFLPQFRTEFFETDQKQTGTYISILGMTIGKKPNNYIISKKDIEKTTLFSIIPIDVFKWEERELVQTKVNQNLVFECEKQVFKTKEEFFSKNKNFKLISQTVDHIEKEDGILLKISYEIEREVGEEKFE